MICIIELNPVLTIIDEVCENDYQNTLIIIDDSAFIYRFSIKITDDHQLQTIIINDNQIVFWKSIMIDAMIDAMIDDNQLASIPMIREESSMINAVGSSMSRR